MDCKILNCKNVHLAKGYCQKHYDRFRSNFSNRRYAQLLRKAKVRNLKCSITKEQLISIVEKGCYYCGSQRLSYGHGLDRLNNNLGYTLENVVGCCGYCNKLKMDLLTPEEMFKVITLLKTIRGADIWKDFDIP